MDFVCPRCQHKYQISENLVGKEVRCKNAACGHVFRVVAAREPLIASPQAMAASPGPKSGVAPPPSGTAASSPRIPAGMPPVPQTGGALDFLNVAADRPMGPKLPVDGADRPAEANAPAVGAAGTHPKRPAILVWIIFYWTFAGILTMFGAVLFQVWLGFAGGAIAAMPDELRRSAPVWLILLLEAVQFLALVLFHYGVLLLVACYGLWTFRAWGLSLARILAIVSAALNLIGVVAAIVLRAAIVASLAGLVISLLVLGYLYGTSNVSQRLGRVASNLRGPGGRGWEGFDQ